MAEEPQIVTIKITGSAIAVTVNKAAHRLGNAKINQAFRHVRKEIHRQKRAAHRESMLADKQKQAAELDAAPKNPPAPVVVAKVEVSKPQIPKTDPLKATKPPTVAAANPAVAVKKAVATVKPGLSKVVPSLTLKKTTLPPAKK